MTSPQGLVVMTFGAEGFFGYGPSTTAPGSILRKENLTQDIVLPYGREGMWWSTYMQEAVPDIKRIDKDEIRRQLLKRHGKWKDPIIQKIITESNIDSVVASWVTPKLPTWVRDGLILVGDAAHGRQIFYYRFIGTKPLLKNYSSPIYIGSRSLYCS